MSSAYRTLYNSPAFVQDRAASEYAMDTQLDLNAYYTDKAEQQLNDWVQFRDAEAQRPRTRRQVRRMKQINADVDEWAQAALYHEQEIPELHREHDQLLASQHEAATILQERAGTNNEPPWHA